VIDGLVSTIIPVHNRPELVVEAVQSVLHQTYRPIEIIIVDDGSTDETPKVLERLAAGSPAAIKVVRQENGGPGLARETGRRQASGEFVQYLDSDDVLLPKKFELQVAGLMSNPQCGVSYGKTRLVKNGIEHLSDVPWKRTGEVIATMFPSFLESRWWGTSTPLYRRGILDEAGPWSTLWNEEDWEYDCRIAALGTALYNVSEFVSEERDHPGQRLSKDGNSDRPKLQQRAAAHRLILRTALSAGLDESVAEMQHFARELFLLSRQCGALGLEDESEELFDLARQASGQRRAQGLDFKFYRWLASIVGWSSVGKLACYSDVFRK